MEKKSADDYFFGKVIGEGSFSTVYLAKETVSGTEYASKLGEVCRPLADDSCENIFS